MKFPLWVSVVLAHLRNEYQIQKAVKRWRKDYLGGEVPRPWREREGLPSHNEWPVRGNALTPALVISAVKCGPIRPVKAESFPTIGGGLPEEDCVVKPKIDPAQFPTLGQALAAIDKAAGRPVITGPDAANQIGRAHV